MDVISEGMFSSNENWTYTGGCICGFAGESMVICVSDTRARFEGELRVSSASRAVRLMAC